MKANETPNAASSMMKKVTGAVLGSLMLVGTWAAAAQAAPVEPMPDGPLCPGYKYMLQIQEVIGESPDVALFSRQIFQCEQDRPGG